MMLITCPNCHTTMECDGVGDLNATTTCPVCNKPFVPGENIEKSAEKKPPAPAAIPVSSLQHKDQPDVSAALEDIKKELRGIHQDTSYTRRAWFGLDLALLIIIVLLLYANCTRIHIPLSKQITTTSKDFPW